MKIILAGGSGQVGTILARAFTARGDDVVVLSRNAPPNSSASAGANAKANAMSAGKNWRTAAWDARTTGDWTREIDGADVVVNLAGRSVNTRYTDATRRAIMSSRVDSVRAVGDAIGAAARPPRVWLQMSTATIYAHRFDAANDELTGIIGGNEPDAPAKWGFSIDVARNWEGAATQFATDARMPNTRLVLMRTSMVMSPDRDGIFDTLLGLTRRGLGGSAAGGRQYVSWIHDADFIRAVDWLITRDDIAGPVNLASPNPLPYTEFMRALRDAAGVRIGLPATRLMLEVGAIFMRTETELVLKSRRVVPTRLLTSGFSFTHPAWSEASRDLVARWQ